MKFSPLKTILSAATIAIASSVALPGYAQTTASSEAPITESSEAPLTEPGEAPMTAPSEVPTSGAMVESGVTSVFLDVDALGAVGLSLTGTIGDVEAPASEDFLVGFTITPETDFAFSDEAGFTLLGGSIEHTGGVVFNGGTEAELAVGNFSIGFDPNRVDETTGATGFFVQDLLTTGAILFDIAGVAPSFDGENLTIDGELLVSSELSGALGNPNLLGAPVGSAQVNANAGELSAAAPPSSSTTAALQTDPAGVAAPHELF